MYRTTLTFAVISLLGLTACSPTGSEETSSSDEMDAQGETTVLIATELGDITVELNPSAAPITVANFLMHVDAGVYEGGSFYRAVRDENERPDIDPMNLIQGGFGRDGYPGAEGITHEPTIQTGLTHSRGAISMGRYEVGTAATEFFIMVNDYQGLDAGPGTRNPDEAGYAVRGQVLSGMDVVEAIWGQPTSLANAPDDYQYPQYIDAPVEITEIRVIE
ncbi:peptidylprolyl isomerase [Maricaulaceae bacterium NA33B04]|nr:peptidylprolyl isomerase [Maricaulaceae bacterium NA33B04]